MTNHEEVGGAILTLTATYTDSSIAEKHSLSPDSKTVIGRAPDCQIILDPHKYITVSRHHAEIKAIGDRWQIEDLKTTNGTFVNGSPVGSSQPLKSGDRITLGTTGPEFTFAIVQPQVTDTPLSQVIPFKETQPQLETKSPTELKLDLFDEEFARQVTSKPDTPALKIVKTTDSNQPKPGDSAVPNAGKSLWNLILVRELYSISRNGEPPLALAFSSDGQIIASATSDKAVKLCNVVDRLETATLKKQELTVKALAFSPDKQILASGSQNGAISLWNVASQTEIATLRQELAVKALAFSSDGQILASGSQNGAIELWNVVTRKKTVILSSEPKITSLSFSPDGTLLASGNEAGKVEVWNLTEEEATTVYNHPQSIMAIAFSPDGNVIASADARGRIKLWNLAIEEQIATLTVPGGHGAMAISADGRIVAGSDREGIIKLWQII